MSAGTQVTVQIARFARTIIEFYQARAKWLNAAIVART